MQQVQAMKCQTGVAGTDAGESSAQRGLVRRRMAIGRLIGSSLQGIRKASSRDVEFVSEAKAPPRGFDVCLERARVDSGRGRLPILSEGVEGWMALSVRLVPKSTWQDHVLVTRETGTTHSQKQREKKNGACVLHQSCV